MTLRSMLVNVGPLFWSRRHRMRLEPVHQVSVSNGWYESTGSEPQFLLHASGKRLPQGWCRVRLEGHAEGSLLHPVIYFGDETGFSRERTFTLHPRGGQRWGALVRLPEDVTALCFHPLEAPGRIVIQQFEIHVIPT